MQLPSVLSLLLISTFAQSITFNKSEQILLDVSTDHTTSMHYNGSTIGCRYKEMGGELQPCPRNWIAEQINCTVLSTGLSYRQDVPLKCRWVRDLDCEIQRPDRCKVIDSYAVDFFRPQWSVTQQWWVTLDWKVAIDLVYLLQCYPFPIRTLSDVYNQSTLSEMYEITMNAFFAFIPIAIGLLVILMFAAAMRIPFH